MSTLCLNDEYFNYTPTNFEVNDFDLFVAEITKCKIKYFEFKGKNYKHTWDGISNISKSVIDENIDMYEKVNLFGDIIKDNKLYKFVMKKEDKYYSYYDTKFEYKMNDDIFAVGNGSGTGIYCGLYEDRFGFSYSYAEKSALIELDVKEEDLIDIDSYSGTFKFKKVKFIKEIEDNKELY